jgi:hypothetical protein
MRLILANTATLAHELRGTRLSVGLLVAHERAITRELLVLIHALAPTPTIGLVAHSAS